MGGDIIILVILSFDFTLIINIKHYIKIWVTPPLLDFVIQNNKNHIMLLCFIGNKKYILVSRIFSKYMLTVFYK